MKAIDKEPAAALGDEEKPMMAASNPSRRLFLAAGSASAVFGTLSQAVAADIGALIARHRSASSALDEAAGEHEKIEDAYDTASSEFLIPSFLGGAYSSKFGRDGCREHITAGYENKRRGLVQIERIAPDLAAQTRAVLDNRETENLELVDKLFAEEDERREFFGLARAERRLDEASDAEREAALALCSHRCRTSEEAQQRALYILGCEPIRSDYNGEYFKALLRSFIDESQV